MEKIKKEINDYNKDIVKDISNLYNKLSSNIDKSYYYGQKSGYEEMLSFFKQYQNKSIKYISPKSISNYLLQKSEKNKLLLNQKNSNELNKRKPNKANFNALFYNQTFNNDNMGNKKSGHNIFPTSSEDIFDHNGKKNVFGSILKGENTEQINHVNILKNHNINNNYIFENNNIDNDTQDIQMIPSSPLRVNNLQGNYNLKRKKNYE